ncbi:hypothetical protein [Streptomyces macrosporus]|uniref:Uncharacterized protein n=1 Tax=Streptomyces macrosporus TaxID=44032 RepID=A0ABP5XP31_9ACTN
MAVPGGISRGARWTNGQLLWHMLFGYLIVRVLLVVTRLFARLPRGVSMGFARLLNAATGPFDAVNHAGPVGAVKVCGPRRMGAAFDRITTSLRHRLEAENDVGLTRGMHYPVRWDPFFTDYMARAAVAFAAPLALAVALTAALAEVLG